MSALIRFHYDPFAEFGGLLDNTLNARSWPHTSSAEGCQRPRARHLDSFRPKLDLHASEDSNVVTATFELPGLKSEDVTIDVHHDRLTVSGESSASTSNEEGEGGYAIHERRYGKFSRAIQLPVGTKPEDVKAKMENGVLTVTFPKTTPEQLPQRVVVQ